MAVEKVGQDERKKLRATCKNCGAILEFYPTDVRHKVLYCLGEAEVSSTVVCPQCRATVTVKC